jgi:outer membrane receptor protein involved in Fe transport
MRVPSPVELTCADPDAPCTLPNIFVADPPLKPVIGTTVELGGRGRWTPVAGTGGQWSVAIYRTELRDDIQFISAGRGAANSGYFRNIGRTRREGFELGGTLPIGSLLLTAHYSYLRATFQTGFAENSPNNSTAAPDGTITVNRGNRIPGLPAQLFKLRAQWDPTPAIALGATLIAAGSQYARGDENNRDRSGPVPGYTVMHLDAHYRLDANWQLFANVTNLFNVRYQNFGILGVNYFRGPGDAFAPALAGPGQFRTPGAPLGAWIGLRYSFAEGRG